MYLVHLINWVPLGLAALLATRSEPRWRLAALVALAGLGCWGYAAAVQAQFIQYPDALRKLPVIEWLRQDGLATTRYCTDVGSAAVLGAHTGRRFYPSEGTIFERVTQEDYFSRLEAIASAFDVKAAGQESTWRYYANFATRSTCDAFPLQEKLLVKLGVSASTIDALTGCPRQQIQTNDQRIERAIEGKAPAVKSLADVCDQVVVDDRLQNDWHLPSSAKPLAHVGGYTIWNLHP